MNTRRSVAAQALHNTLTAQPAGIPVYIIDGVERLAFTTADVARLIFGAPADTTEAKQHREWVTYYHHRGLLAGRKVGNSLLFPGSAVAEFVAWLGEERTA